MQLTPAQQSAPPSFRFLAISAAAALALGVVLSSLVSMGRTNPRHDRRRDPRHLAGASHHTGPRSRLDRGGHLICRVVLSIVLMLVGFQRLAYPDFAPVGGGILDVRARCRGV